MLPIPRASCSSFTASTLNCRLNLRLPTSGFMEHRNSAFNPQQLSQLSRPMRRSCVRDDTNDNRLDQTGLHRRFFIGRITHNTDTAVDAAGDPKQRGWQGTWALPSEARRRPHSLALDQCRLIDPAIFGTNWLAADLDPGADKEGIIMTKATIETYTGRRRNVDVRAPSRRSELR